MHLWKEHGRADFPPDLRGEEVSGIDMVMLDADVAGCISTWLTNGGQLDAARREILAQSMSDLDRVVDQLRGDDERYYRRLREMAALILDMR
jgi:hypothetical protein